MKIEAEKNNHPDSYAIYGKIQRKLIAKERDLSTKVKQNEDVQAQAGLLHKEEKKINESSGFNIKVDKVQLVLTLAFYFIGFVVPLFLIP